MNETVSDEDIIDAINSIALDIEHEYQWAQLSKAHPPQLKRCLQVSVEDHVAYFIRRLIERAYLNEQ